jgi:hypothetical protein
MSGESDPKNNIGKPHKRGMLPYGGAAQRGKVAFVVTIEEFDKKKKILKSIYS